jgi:hypothetical protein
MREMYDDSLDTIVFPAVLVHVVYVSQLEMEYV